MGLMASLDAIYANLLSTRSGSFASMLDDFANSTESQGLYNQVQVSAKVNQIYQFLFGRDADPEGSLYWSGMVTSGQITLSSAAYIIAFNAQAADAAILAVKKDAAAIFSRRLDTTGKRQAYLNNVVPGRTWLSTVRSLDTENSALVTLDGVIAGL